MANTSIIHCGRGRERMEVDFYAKLDWQLSLCPLYLRGVGVRALPLIAWLAQSNPDMFAIKAFSANSIWVDTSHITGEKYVISLNPYFMKSKQDGIFADWVKMQFKSCGALFDSSQEPRPGPHLPMLRFLSWWKSHQPPAIHSGIRRIHTGIHRIHRNQPLKWANGLSWVEIPIKFQLLPNSQCETKTLFSNSTWF